MIDAPFIMRAREGYTRAGRLDAGPRARSAARGLEAEPGEQRGDDNAHPARPHRDRMRADRHRPAVEQTGDMQQRDDGEDRRGEQRKIPCSHVDLLAPGSLLVIEEAAQFARARRVLQLP